MANIKWLRVGLVIGIPVLLVVLLLLQGTGEATLAEGPVGAVGAKADSYFHESLSSNLTNQSSMNDIEANDEVMVVVWKGSQDAAGKEGAVHMKFKREGDATWQHQTIWRFNEADPKLQGDQPAVALHGFVAHVVWIDQDKKLRYLAWNMTSGAGWCNKDSNVTNPEQCWEMVGDSDNAKSRPQVAVDAGGVPHVVWREFYYDVSKSEEVYYVYYDNRNGASWGSDAQIATPITTSGWQYTENYHPVIAADDQYVYVAWAVDDQAVTTAKCKDGIYFRRRNGIADPATWTPALGSEAKALSAFTFQNNTTCGTVLIDTWPAVGAVDGNLFALWERKDDFVDDTDPPVYTYTMHYRVLTGGDVETDWSPSPVPTLTTAVLPVSVNTKFAYGGNDDYSGVRPSIQLVQSGSVITSYVAWHGWTPPASSGGGGGDNPAAVNVVRPQAIDPERFITDNYPYQVFYASAGHSNLANLSNQWTSPITIPVQADESIHFSPDFAVVSYSGGVYYPHFSVLKRSTADKTLRNVWYTNQDFSLNVYLPIVFKNKIG
ncbi:MAG: hypothetical protein JXA89_14600 [Anaerolineae bacterium]|nr:hypothetical protein [Anaerolineae bacterium]